VLAEDAVLSEACGCVVCAPREALLLIPCGTNMETKDDGTTAEPKPVVEVSMVHGEVSVV
jgi:hypothetical protein